jgi:4-amino-4-deoxy-L-arabinose transferase-like glycosyltransferase
MKMALFAALVTASLAAACYTRHLDQAPPYLQHDEVNFAIQAHAIATTGRDVDGNRLPLYFRELAFPVGRDPLYIYAAAAALRVLPPTDATLRLPSTIVAVITIFLVVLLAYELFGNLAAAVVAGILLAMTPAFFIQSRKALSVVYPLPFVAWWLLFLLRYARTGRRRDLVLAMGGLGVSVYAYLTMLVLVPLYALMTLAIVAVRRNWHHAVVGGAALAAAAVPLAWWHVIHPNRYREIISSYGIYDPRLDVLRGAKDLLSWFSISTRTDVYWQSLNPGPLFFSGESVLTDSTRAAGSFPLAYLALLPLGVACMLRQPASPRSLLVLACLITAPIPGVLVVSTSLYRFLVILLFGSLVATAGFLVLWSKPQLWARSLAVAAVLSTVLLFRGFHDYYLTTWPAVAAGYFGGNIRGAVEVVTKAPRDETRGLVYLSGRVPYLDRYFELYRRLHGRHDLAGRVRGLDVERGTDWRDAPERSVAIVASGDAAALEALQAAAWRATAEIHNPDGGSAFFVYASPR